MPHNLLSTREVAGMLRISQQAVLDAIYRGALRATRGGRRWIIKIDDMRRYDRHRWAYRENRTPDGKICTGCGEWKPESEFRHAYRGGKKMAFLNAQCYTCHLDYLSRRRQERRERYPKPPIDGKICPQCGEWKAADLFGRNYNNNDTLFSICKACRRLRESKYKNGRK